jgi:hypothetical protein
MADIAERHGLDPMQIARWRANKDLMMTKPGDQKTVHGGRASSFAEFEEALLDYVNERRTRNQGIFFC